MMRFACLVAVAVVCVGGLLLASVGTVDAVDFGDDEGELVFAHVIFRHGNRTPIASYPTDPYRDPSKWSHGWGQLTNTGKQTHYNLGRWLRNRYRRLLSEKYSPDEIYVQSTDVDRVIMSALSNLAGLYPPQGADVWNPNLPWQPIPVHAIPKSMDNLLASSKPCAALDYAFNQYLQGEEFQKLNRTLGHIFKYLTKHAQTPINSYLSVYDLYSCLDVEEGHGLELPKWTRKVFPEPLRSMSGSFFTLKTRTRRLARLAVGPLLKEIFTRFQQKLNRTLNPNRSLWMYSGHDITVVNLLNGLGVVGSHNPPFAACVMVELRVPNPPGDPYVSIFYRNSSAEPEALPIPHCGTRCPLHKMVKLYEDIIPGDWEEECRAVPTTTCNRNL